MSLPRKILIATDLSDASAAAVRTGAELARALDADVLLLTSFDPTPFLPVVEFSTEDTWSGILDEQEKASRKALEEQRAELLEGVPCDVAVLRASGTAVAIADFAKDRGADLIVVGSHGRTGLKRFMLGSVAEKVVRLAQCSVLVVR